MLNHYLISAPSVNITAPAGVEQPKPAPKTDAFVPIKVIAKVGGGGDIEIIKPTSKYSAASKLFLVKKMI